MPIAFSPEQPSSWSFTYNGVDPTLGTKNLRRAIPRDRRIPRRHAQFIRN